VGKRQKEIQKSKFRQNLLVIAVDIDNVLTEEAVWTEAQEPAPNKKMIWLVNDLYLSHFVVLHTARRRELFVSTINWLEKHGVRYHAIRMEKMSADIYIDDKSINPTLYEPLQRR
jgi:uncharacterized HAD superfamily protein